MPPAQQQLGTPIPDRNDDLVALKQTLERVPSDPGEAEIADLDDAAGRDEDVGGLEVPVEDVVGVEVEDAVEELVEEGLERREGDGRA